MMKHRLLKCNQHVSKIHRESKTPQSKGPDHEGLQQICVIIRASRHALKALHHAKISSQDGTICLGLFVALYSEVSRLRFKPGICHSLISVAAPTAAHMAEILSPLGSLYRYRCYYCAACCCTSFCHVCFPVLALPFSLIFSIPTL